MAKFRALGKLFKAKKKLADDIPPFNAGQKLSQAVARQQQEELARKIAKGIEGAVKIGGTAAIAGGVVGAASAPPGLRKAGAVEGAALGITGITAAIAAPKAVKIVFRRIRGRIIPIRVKK